MEACKKELAELFQWFNKTYPTVNEEHLNVAIGFIMHKHGFGDYKIKHTYAPEVREQVET